MTRARMWLYKTGIKIRNNTPCFSTEDQQVGERDGAGGKGGDYEKEEVAVAEDKAEKKSRERKGRKRKKREGDREEEGEGEEKGETGERKENKEKRLTWEGKG